MDSRWYKYNKISKKKRHTLHSLGVGFVFFVLLYIITKIFSISLCPVKNIFGFSCFGCGLTRGFISILELDFKMAVEYNVLSIPIFAGICLYFMCGVIDIIFNKNYIKKIEKQLVKKYMYIIYVVILTVSYIYNHI